MWLEASSCSNCEAYQARRANLRMKSEGETGTRHPHTSNGSAVALPRTMIAILESYQDGEGRVAVPEVLRSYMGGRPVIEARAAS
jgi:seryl-tRNA synthetase